MANSAEMFKISNLQSSSQKLITPEKGRKNSALYLKKILSLVLYCNQEDDHISELNSVNKNTTEPY